MITRRGLIAGILGSMAAPGIVRASSLMPGRGIIVPTMEVGRWEGVRIIEDFNRACGIGIDRKTWGALTLQYGMNGRLEWSGVIDGVPRKGRVSSSGFIVTLDGGQTMDNLTIWPAV